MYLLVHVILSEMI